MALSAVTAIAGVGVLTAAYSGSTSDDETVVLDVADAITDLPPSTVAPLAEPDTTAPPTTQTPPTRSDDDELPVAASSDQSATPPVADADESGESVDDDGLSPLADLLGPRYSAVPEEIEPRPRPVGLDISSIDVDRYPIRDVGLEDNGELEVPDETEICW